MSERTDQIVDLDHVVADQEVYGSDGKEVGIVAGVTADLDTGEPYLEVSAGFLKTLFIPRSTIQLASPDQPIRLKVPSDEALRRFGTKPRVI